ncbi:hypothetical protein Ndes2526B_g09546 [Nannochloris sp. 'desiccata']
MAKGGDKRRIQENGAHVQKLKFLIAFANVVYIGSRFFIYKNSAISWHGGALLLTSLAYTFCFSGIIAALAPHYSANGDIIFSGADLKTGGVLSYYHDIVYLSLFSQILGAWTNYAWLAMAAIPAYALHALITKVLLPSWKTPEEMPESELDRKRREKRERQSARAEKFARR